MQVTLSEELSRDVQQLINSGRFRTVDDVLKAAIVALQSEGDIDDNDDNDGDREYWADVLKGIDESEEDYRDGRYFELNDYTRAAFRHWVSCDRPG